VKYRAVWGNGAAVAGTSSHGGLWEGQQTLATDYGNWADAYARFGGQAAFYADCRAVGLTPGLISKARGYPEEPWHVIDLDPWAPAPAGTTASPFNLEEFLMSLTPDEQQEILREIRNLSAQVLGTGGFTPSIAGRVISIDEVTAATKSRVENLDRQVTGADGAFVKENVVQRLIDLKAQGGLGSVSDGDLARIAVAVNDEMHRRLGQ